MPLHIWHHIAHYISFSLSYQNYLVKNGHLLLKILYSNFVSKDY